MTRVDWASIALAFAVLAMIVIGVYLAFADDVLFPCIASSCGR
jgi:hypothetical protein